MTPHERRASSLQERYRRGVDCFGCGPANPDGLPSASFASARGRRRRSSPTGAATPATRRSTGSLNGGIIGDAARLPLELDRDVPPHARARRRPAADDASRSTTRSGSAARRRPTGRSGSGAGRRGGRRPGDRRGRADGRRHRHRHRAGATSSPSGPTIPPTTAGKEIPDVPPLPRPRPNRRARTTAARRRRRGADAPAPPPRPRPCGGSSPDSRPCRPTRPATSPASPTS